MFSHPPQKVQGNLAARLAKDKAMIQITGPSEKVSQVPG